MTKELSKDWPIEEYTMGPLDIPVMGKPTDSVPPRRRFRDPLPIPVMGEGHRD